MNTSGNTYKDVDSYISTFSPEIGKILKKIRTIILKTAPDSEERIAYGMPAYKYKGKPLVYFAAFQHHIGFYATPRGHEAFAKDLAVYKQGKGSVQFPLDQSIPYDLIQRMVEFNVQALEINAPRKPAANQKGPKGVKKTCSRGHVYYKSSDCPVCPICWSGYYKKQVAGGLPKELSAPALRALLSAEITTLKKLAAHTEKEILSLHGMGKASLPLLRVALQEKGLRFREK